MGHNKSLSRWKAASLLLALCLPFLGWNCSSWQAEQLQGTQAPSFRLPLLNHASAEFLDLKTVNVDRPVLLVFFTTWCPSCNAKIPALNKFYLKNKDKVHLAGINISESKEDLEPYIQRKKISYPIAMDLDGSVAEQFLVESIPTMILLEKGGKILYYGYTIPKNWSELINQE